MFTQTVIIAAKNYSNMKSHIRHFRKFFYKVRPDTAPCSTFSKNAITEKVIQCFIKCKCHKIQISQKRNTSKLWLEQEVFVALKITSFASSIKLIFTKINSRILLIKEINVFKIFK